jgi:monoamine oxidase
MLAVGCKSCTSRTRQTAEQHSKHWVEQHQHGGIGQGDACSLLPILLSRSRKQQQQGGVLVIACKSASLAN